VTFVPDQQQRMGMSPVVRTVLFWVLMVALAAVLWRMASNDNRSGPGEPYSLMSYSDFMAQVDKNNVASIRLLESPATAAVEGQLRDPQEKFRTTIPKETIPALTDQLRKQGAVVEVSEEKRMSGRDMIANLAPFLAIVALWIVTFMARSRRNKPTPSASSVPPTSTVPTNRPLG
jgi:cell division protease FtsH